MSRYGQSDAVRTHGPVEGEGVPTPSGEEGAIADAVARVRMSTAYLDEQNASLRRTASRLLGDDTTLTSAGKESQPSPGATVGQMHDAISALGEVIEESMRLATRLSDL